MIRIDYNKIMCIVAVVLIACFVISITNYYINVVNTDELFKQVLLKVLEYILPSLLLLYLYNQNTKIKVSNYMIKNKRIPSNFNGYKIAHISDFHNTNSKRAKSIIIKKLKEHTPDILVITGDLIDSRRTNIYTAKEFVTNIKLSLNSNIYYVLGNHESRLKNISKLEENITKAGAIILRNEKIELTKSGNNNQEQYIQLIGIDDPAFSTNIEKENEIKRVLNKNLKAIGKDKDKFTLLITHRPEHIDIYSNNNVDLVFTGHAHGGQIRVPFVGGIIAPGQGLLPKYTSGVYNINNTSMVVNRGVGNSKFPFRINNRPELVFVTLEGEK